MRRSASFFFLFFLALGLCRPAAAQVLSGSYVGNGSGPRPFAGLGFRPDVVVIKADSSNFRGVMRTTTMSLSKEMVSSIAAAPGLVLSLDADGFTVSGDDRVNKGSVTYHWIASKAAAGESKVGSYTGNGAPNRNLAGLGFLPALVVVIPESADPVYFRSTPMPAGLSFDLDNSIGDSNRIQALQADGFQVGSDNDVNRGGTTYHYAAWKAVPRKMAVGSYVGLGNDDLSITGVGFRPEYVVVKRDGLLSSSAAAHKPFSTGPSTDGAMVFNAGANDSDWIQALEADGFEVGNHARVNNGGDTYYWLAFGSGSATLTTARGGQTITVETQAVKMVWDGAAGGGLRQFYAKTEANPLVSRVGTDDKYNLFTTSVSDQPNGGPYFRENDGPGTLELLEATPTRVRIRQKYDYAASIHLERDWTAYASPRLGISEALVFDTGQSLRGTTGLRAKGEPTCPGNTFYCAGRADPTSRVWITTDNSTTYSDMLAIPYTDPFFGRSGAGVQWETAFEDGSPLTPNTWLSRVRETTRVSTGPGIETRFYLFHPRLEGLTSSGSQWQPYANDYRSPSPLTISAGSMWVDPAESTAAGDAFNEAEAAYVLNLDPVTGLDFSMDGTVSNPRFRPFFKIRQWRSLQEPATVTLQGATLKNELDYSVDVKPIAHAAACGDAACGVSPVTMARGGLLGDPQEYLADPTRNGGLAFSPGSYLYLGADARFRGLNVELDTPGAGAVDLDWEYWDGGSWASLESIGGFNDLSVHFTRNGAIFWGTDPVGWAPRAVVAGGPSLYYVRASLASGSYSQPPVERVIKTDILLFQYWGDITTSGRRFVMGPAASATHYRSIGFRVNYGTGQPEGSPTTITATNGSTVVTGNGTAWRGSNRGRGDRITIDGVDYTIYAVISDTQLELTTPFTDATGSGKSYVIARKFPNLPDWANCINGTTACPGVASGSLVSDNRSEIGIAYSDGTDFAPVTISGSSTDATHTITLTADHGHRHYGRPTAGATINNATSSPAIRVLDDYVTVEWLRVKGGAWGSSDAVEVGNLGALNRVTLRSLLLHNTSGNGIEITGDDTVADVYNNVVYEAGVGILVGTALSSGGQVRILNNTVYSCNTGGGASGIRSVTGANLTVRNNIAHSNTGGDFGVGGSVASNNLSGDSSAPGPGSVPGQGLGAVNFVGAGTGDLHIQAPSSADNAGADLSAVFTEDVDGGLRTTPWDIGADDLPATSTDLAVTKSDGQLTAVPGSPTQVVYTITVFNNGPSPVGTLTLTDPVPPGLVGWSFDPASSGVYTSGTGQWTFAPTLDPGQSAFVRLRGTVHPSARGTLTNTATVFPPGGIVDPVPQNDSATDVDTLTPQVDVSLLMNDSPDPALIDDQVTYTLDIANAGPSEATEVVVTDTLPAGTELVSAVPTAGSCNFDAGTRTVACGLGSLAASGSASVTIVVRAVAAGFLTNVARVTRQEPDTATGNDTATAVTTVGVPTDGVRFITVTSTDGQDLLEWLNPNLGASYATTKIVYKKVTGSSACSFPADENDGTDLMVPAGMSGGHHTFPHGPLPNDNTTYCYGAFVRKTDLSFSGGHFAKGRPFGPPFDPSAGVEWAFATGASSLAPPGVGSGAVHATSNDNAVYAIDMATGTWPTSPTAWKPAVMSGPSQGRPTTIPIGVQGAVRVIFVSSQDRHVYALDADTGQFLWPVPPDLGDLVLAAPSGMFTAFGGNRNELMVGNRKPGGSTFYGLNAASGTVAWSIVNSGFPDFGQIGIITSQAVVDYPSRRAYFTSWALGASPHDKTVWCLDLSPAIPTVLWARAHPNVSTSPTLRGNRLYVGTGTASGEVLVLDANTGLEQWRITTNDGPVKSFVMTDRIGGRDFFFATTATVWAYEDDGTATPPAAPRWSNPLPSPSAPILFPGAGRLYVGGGDGALHVLATMDGADAAPPIPLGDPITAATVGGPTIDIRGNRIYVGTEAGVVYKVQVP